MVAMLVMGHSVNWKSTFWSLLTKTQAAFFTIRLFCDPYLNAPLKRDPSHFTGLHFDVYTNQLTATDLVTGIYSTL